jgi:hypothetical protein
MGICRFKTSELKPLIEHAKAAAEFDMGYENMTDEECIAAGLPPITNRTPRGPALLFVHDQGVYLMSNGEPRLLTEDGKSNHVVYAEGCNPNIGEFDDWYLTSKELVGGDDFVEILPIPDYWLSDCDRFETFDINATGSSISYGFADPKPVLTLGATVWKSSSTATYAELANSINDLNLSVRCRKCTKKLGIMTVYDLTQQTAAELLEIKNFGAVSLAEVREKLAARGLTLKGETLANQRHVVSR